VTSGLTDSLTSSVADVSFPGRTGHESNFVYMSGPVLIYRANKTSSKRQKRTIERDTNVGFAEYNQQVQFVASFLHTFLSSSLALERIVVSLQERQKRNKFHTLANFNQLPWLSEASDNKTGHILLHISSL
jgi:hypothetical protein